MKVKETAPAYFTKSKPFTYQDYLEMPEDGKRYQVINGELVMTPAPLTIHQKISGILEFELRKFIEENDIGTIFDAPFDVVLSNEVVVQPDILFVSHDNSGIITKKNISGAPDLIVEILSPSTGYYDLVEKKEIYAKFGVKEYWIIDPEKQWVEVYSNKENKFQLNDRLEKVGALKSTALKGFQLEIKNIFRL